MSLLAALAEVASARTRAAGVAPAPVEHELVVRAVETGDGLRLNESGDSARNRTIWRRTGEGIELAHLRFGDDRPVMLGTLIEIEPGRWRFGEPHRCGDDIYDTAVRVHADGATLRWRITGPKKNQRVVTRYRR